MDRLYTGARDTGAPFGATHVVGLGDESWSVSAGSSAIMHPFLCAGYPGGPRPSAAGISRALTEGLERYSHCRQKVLMTDDRPEQKAFYEALGFTRLDLREGPTLRALSNFRLSYATECGRNSQKAYALERATVQLWEERCPQAFTKQKTRMTSALLGRVMPA